MYDFWSFHDMVRVLRPLHLISRSQFRFASVTVNLGPTFLSGALAANAGAVMDEPSCPLVQASFILLSI